MEYLSDLEKDKIINFNEDTVLVEAIRKVMLASMYSNGTLRGDVKSEPMRNAAFGLVALTQKNGVVSNADLGEDLRGLFQGVTLLETAFKHLQTIKKEVVDGTPSPYNEAE